MKIPHAIAALCLLLSACADVTGSAAEINGQSLSRSDVSTLLGQIGEDIQADEVLAQQSGSTPGTVQRVVGASVLTLAIQNELFGQRLVAAGVELTQADIDNALQANQPSGSDTFDQLFAEWTARGSIVEAEGMSDPLADANVVVDPRYGRWDPDLSAVVPNEAPAPASS